ncbi:histone H1A, sperm-like [Myzus persicae]|uniref:histone H1A, sperm-like n=1 Tax=Myzus persicae TaxID=13164 RepID=UPI000B93689B|nr:histone H1A, sperm-like [Myzus persicae]
MTDTIIATAPAPVAASPVVKKSPAKKKIAGTVKKTVALHPTTSVMVTSAIKELKEKKGSSLPAIKKYLAANYKVDPAKLAPFIRKFLKAAVVNGTVVQTKGNGASGHFKLPVAEAKPKKTVVAKKKKSIVKKVKAPGTPKRKLTATKKVKAGEPAAKKVKKAVAVPTKAKATTKTKKSPAKPKKPAVVKPKAAPKVKKAAPIKKTVVPKKK